jgi:hypothetical protein
MGGNVYAVQRPAANGGSLLAGGINTLYPTSNLTVLPGGTLNLNGSSQLFSDFINASSFNGVTDGAGGIITGTANSLLVSNQTNSACTFIGSMTGAMGFVKSGLQTSTLRRRTPTPGRC